MNKDVKDQSRKDAWQSKSKTLVYENPWIAVSHHNVVTPTGTDGIYGVVNFKNHAVGVLPIDKKGGTWLVRQSRYPHDCFTWEIPEGGAPKGEPLLEAAKRELQEETGLQAEQWQTWLELQTSNSVTDELATIYLAQGLTQGDTALEATEDITVKYLPIKEAVAMVYRSEIVDAMSVAALLKVACAQEFCQFFV